MLTLARRGLDRDIIIFIIAIPMASTTEWSAVESIYRNQG